MADFDGVRVKRRVKGVADREAATAERTQAEASLAAAQEHFKIRFMNRRKELQLSQRDVAKLLDVSVNTVQAYESGQLPRGGNLIYVARALGCSVDWLLGMDGCGICVSPDLLPLESYDSTDSPTSLGGYMRVKHFKLHDSEPTSNDIVFFSMKWLKEKSRDPEKVCKIFPPPFRHTDSMMLMDLGVTGVYQGCQYLVQINDHYSVNRVSIRPGGSYLLSSDDESQGDAFEVPVGEVEIIGRIFWASHSI